MLVQPVCPACGSKNLRCVDTVIVTQGITSWSLDQGVLSAEEFDGDSETHWDTSTPAAKPYDCGDCGWEGADEDLLGTLEPVIEP